MKLRKREPVHLGERTATCKNSVKQLLDARKLQKRRSSSDQSTKSSVRHVVVRFDASSAPKNGVDSFEHSVNSHPSWEMLSIGEMLSEATTTKIYGKSANRCLDERFHSSEKRKLSGTCSKANLDKPKKSVKRLKRCRQGVDSYLEADVGSSSGRNSSGISKQKSVRMPKNKTKRNSGTKATARETPMESTSRSISTSDDEMNESFSRLCNFDAPIVVEAAAKIPSSSPTFAGLQASHATIEATSKRERDVLNGFVGSDAVSRPKQARADVVVAEATGLSLAKKPQVSSRSRAARKSSAGDGNSRETSAGSSASAGGSSEGESLDVASAEESSSALEDGRVERSGCDSSEAKGDSAIDANAAPPRNLRFYSLRDKVVVVMKPPCLFHFSGKLKVGVLSGRVAIYGATFDAGSACEVYSPRGYGLVCVESVHSASRPSTGVVCESLRAGGVDEVVLTSLRAEIEERGDDASVLLLENLENGLTRFLNAHCPFRLFPRVEDQSNYACDHPKRAEIVLQSNFRYGGKNGLRSGCAEDDWRRRVIHEFLRRRVSCTLLAGGKGVGKSTSARQLVNDLLPISGRVVLLDFDPGQTEFTVPGCVSVNVVERPLLGPNFTHLKTPFYQLYIGEVNVVRCISRYIDSLEKLVRYARESPELRGLPVVVNTMGFCRGLGWNIMVFILKLVRPTNVVQIVSQRTKNNFEKALVDDVIDRETPKWRVRSEDASSTESAPLKYELRLLTSRAEINSDLGDGWKLEPHQQRELVTLAYFSEIVRDGKGAGSLNNAPPPSVNDTPPYMIPLSSLTVSLSREGVPPSSILAAMNGNMVALCGIDLDDRLPPSGDDAAPSACPKTLIREPLTTCYGFGIVRGVDMESGHAFVNTPLPSSVMRFVNCFVGCMPIPVGLLQLNRPGVPYSGGPDDLPTSRESRRGYFRMRL